MCTYHHDIVDFIQYFSIILYMDAVFILHFLFVYQRVVRVVLYPVPTRLM